MAVKGMIVEMATGASDYNGNGKFPPVFAKIQHVCTSHSGSIHSYASHVASSNNIAHIKFTTAYYICEVEKKALGQVFSGYFGFPCQFSFHQQLHIHHHLSSGAGTIGQLVADVPSGLSLAPPQETKKKKEQLKTTFLKIKK
jgi:hypothetical protein